MPDANRTTEPIPKKLRFRTPKQIEALRPAAQDFEAADAGAPGLRLRVTRKGAKVFRWYVLDGGARRAITLGKWALSEQRGFLTLGQARDCLEKLKAAHAGGTLRAAEADLDKELGRSRVGQVIADAESMTVAALCERFYADRILPFRERPEGARQVIDRDIIPKIGAVPVSAITKAVLTAPVTAAVERGSPGHAVTVLQITKMLTKYAFNRDLIPVDLAASLDRKYLGGETHSRGRFMADDELSAYLRTMEPRNRPERLKLKTSEAVLFALGILLRVGERPVALLSARWTDIDLKAGIWTQPPERQAKKKKTERETAQPWEIPLSKQTVRLFRKLRALTGRGERVLPVADHQVLNRALTRLQDRVLKLDAAKGSIVTYDLRRSCRAGLERLGVEYATCEKILNHRVRGSVAATYARDPLIESRRAAAQRWADHLDRLAAPTPANVVPFARPGADAAVGA